jgi:hypothetical protein
MVPDNVYLLGNLFAMPRYIIEREIRGAGQLSKDDLRSISQKSCSVLQEMGSGIEWIESFVTPDKIYCVYEADNKDRIMEHASKGGFPANSVEEVKTMISPATAEL